MKPGAAYTIAIASSATVSAAVTWLVNDHAARTEWAPLVSALFTPVIGSLTIGNALRGSTTHMTDERAPLSMRERWILGVAGALCVIGFALALPALYAHRFG